MRYPIGIQTFETIITGKYVYADKTDLVYELAQEHVCFLSRPRRFGKSLLISTLEAYFLGRKDLFSGLHMEKLEKSICAMAEKFRCSVEEMKVMLKKHYDGYHFSAEMLDIYNPFSIINAFDSLSLGDFWYRSGPPTYLAKLLDGHHVNVQKLISRPYKAGYFMDYRADVEDLLAMLYQSGYLTIKDYDYRDWVYTLDYPNREVKEGFISLIANGYFKGSSNETENWCLNLSRMFRKGNLDGIRDAFTSFLASIPYEANKDVRALDFETHYQYTFYLINRLLSCYTTLIEKQNSMGRADIIVESDHDIYIFEFKLDKSAEEALKQIDDRQYALPYLADERKLHKIGVNISSKTKTVEDWISI